MPDSTPTAAEHQSVAAVFRPQTLLPSFMITPAPRNPMRDTTASTGSWTSTGI